MSAHPTAMSELATRLAADVVRPFPGSRKLYVPGSRVDLCVPMRVIEQSPTPTQRGLEPNPQITVYDTSGPYSDPDVRIDLNAGLKPLRAAWIAERGDSVELAEPSSAYARHRLHDSSLTALRFPAPRRPRRGSRGNAVTQMHYAKRGIVTPEMEFVAIRENLRREELRTAYMRAGLLGQHPGEHFGARIPDEVTP
jgi:phosphomethylpyrimidine synthase